MDRGVRYRNVMCETEHSRWLQKLLIFQGFGRSEFVSFGLPDPGLSEMTLKATHAGAFDFPGYRQ